MGQRGGRSGSLGGRGKAPGEQGGTRRARGGHGRRREVPVVLRPQALEEQSAAGEALAQARGEQERLSTALERATQEREGLAKEAASVAVQLAAAQRDARARAQEADGLRWVPPALTRCPLPTARPNFGSVCRPRVAGRRRRRWRPASSRRRRSSGSSAHAASSWRLRDGHCAWPRRGCRVSGALVIPSSLGHGASRLGFGAAALGTSLSSILGTNILGHITYLLNFGD